MLRFGTILALGLVLALAPGSALDLNRPASAEEGAKKDKKKNRIVKKAFKRTRQVLEDAQKAAQEGGAMSGRLRTAVIHQRAAALALEENSYALAARLTMEARILAGHVLKANKAEEPREMEFKEKMTALAAEVQLEEGMSLVKAVELATPDEDKILTDLDAETSEADDN